MPNFPTGFDNNASLYLAVNNKRTTLTSAISASALTIPAVDTAGFPDSGFITINSTPDNPLTAEAIAYSSKNATNFFVSQRGADGTTATAHIAGAKIDLTIVAAHHNQLKDAIIQLEYFVGVTGSENFLRQDDNGNVSVGGALSVPGSSSFGSFSVNTFTANSGTITLLGGSNATFNQGRFATSLTVSGLPVLTSAPVPKAIIGDTFVSVVTGTTTINLSADAIISGNNQITISSGTNNVSISGRVPEAIVGGTNISVISGTNIITINNTAGVSEQKAIVGDAFISVVTGTNTINLTHDAIVSGNSQITIVSGTSTVGIFGRVPDAIVSGSPDLTVVSGTGRIIISDNNRALVGADGVTIASGTNIITITGFRNEFVTASGFLQSQIVANQAPINAIVGADGITVTSGTNTTVVQGFRPELITVSGNLQSQITALDTRVTVLENSTGDINKSFTTEIVDRAGGSRNINESFNNRSLVYYTKVSPVASGVTSYLIQFFTKDTFSFADRLEYEANASGIYVDNDLWTHHDSDLTSEMHLMITNTSLVDSAFVVQLKCEKFA